MIEFENMRALTAENPCNLGVYWIIEISLVLYRAHLILRDQDKFIFYVNNYINEDQFNNLYNPDWMKKGIRNIHAIVRKLRLASIRTTNNKLEIAREKRQIREEMIKRWKVETMAAKQCRARIKISLSSEKKDKSDIGDNTDLN